MSSDTVLSADGHNVSFTPAPRPGEMSLPVPGLGTPSHAQVAADVGIPTPSAHPNFATQDLCGTVLFSLACVGVALRYLWGARERMGVAPSRRDLESDWTVPEDTPQNRAAFLARYHTTAAR